MYIILIRVRGAQMLPPTNIVFLFLRPHSTYNILCYLQRQLMSYIVIYNIHTCTVYTVQPYHMQCTILSIRLKSCCCRCIIIIIVYSADFFMHIILCCYAPGTWNSRSLFTQIWFYESLFAVNIVPNIYVVCMAENDKTIMKSSKRL